MDGAINNWQFMKINVPLSSPADTSFVAHNIVHPSHGVVFIMDYSHSIKKVRNRIYNSGQSGTRHMESSSGQTLIWQLWWEAFAFNKTNPIAIHPKITYQHLRFDNFDQMRNRIAEEVLDRDMLQLMYEFRVSLGKQGIRLDPAIELLEQTSEILTSLEISVQYRMFVTSA